MRILQVIPTLTVGGAERTLALLSQGLRSRGHEVAVVSLYDSFGSWIEAELREAGVRMHFLGKTPGLDLRMPGRVAQIVRRFSPDVIHTHMYALKYSLLAYVLNAARMVHTIHTVAAAEAGGGDRIVQALAFRTGVIPVAIGQGVDSTFRQVYGRAARRVIPNSVPVAQFAISPAARDSMRAELCIPSDAPTFVTVGQFVPAKNHEGLLRAFSSSRLRSTRARLLLAGDGELRPRAESLARDLGVADSVIFLGVRSDVPRVLAAGDVFVLASHREGNPLSVMEAMSAGKPVIAPAVGCIPELVTDGAGTLVAPGDEAALEEVMYSYAIDADKCRRHGQSSMTKAFREFDVGIMVSAYEDLYLEITNSRPTVGRASP